MMKKYKKIVFIYRLLGPLKGMFWISVFLMFFAAVWEGVILTTLATYLQFIVDMTQVSSSTFEAGSIMERIYEYFKQIPKENRMLIGFLLTTGTMLIGSVMQASLHTFQTYFSTQFIIFLRGKVFSDLLHSSLTYFDNNKKGELIQMVVNESRSIYNVLKSILGVTLSVLKGLILLFSMVIISIELSGIVILLSAIIFIETVYISKKLKILSNIRVSQSRALMVDTDESIQCIKIIKQFNLYGMMESLFGNHSQRADNINRKQSVILQWQGVIVQAMMLIAVITLIYFNVSYSLVPISLMLTFLFIMRKLNAELGAVNKAYGLLHKSLPEFYRIESFMSNQNALIETGGEHVKDIMLENKILFRNVDLSYDNETVLKNINIEIFKGETIAIVGESGAGKTSLANLLVRLYDTTEGEIIIDGVNIKDYDLNFLRDRISMVNQDNIIFNKTIRENILMGSENESEENMIQAAKNAHIHKFIIQLPNGYDTLVGDRGVKLSGGQRQRINIAQAFLKKPEIMILDEATSALDTKSEQYIQASIDEITHHCTSIIIAHRLSTIRNANKVIVLKKGSIVEEGDWGKLMNLKGTFYDMVQRQIFGKRNPDKHSSDLN